MPPVVPVTEPKFMSADVAVIVTVPAVTAPPEMVRLAKLNWMPCTDKTPPRFASPKLIGDGVVPVAIAFKSSVMLWSKSSGLVCEIGETDEGKEPAFELCEELEFEEIVVFTGLCEIATFAGGPFAVVNDAVIRCVIGFETAVADVAERVE